MHSTGRGFIGYQRAIATLFVPPEGFFQSRYQDQGSYLSSYRDIGQPIVLLTTREIRTAETAFSVDLLRAGSAQIHLWSRRFALVRSVNSGAPGLGDQK